MDEKIKSLIEQHLPVINEDDKKMYLKGSFELNPKNYSILIDGLKLTLKGAQTLFKPFKDELNSNLKLFTSREKEYLNLIEEMTDLYNNEYVKKENKPEVKIYGRKAQTHIEIKIKSLANIPNELAQFIYQRNEQIILEWYELKLQTDGVLPLVEGIDAKLVKTYKGVK